MKHLKHHIGFLWLQSVVVAMSLFSLPLCANDFYLNNMTSPQVSDMFRYGNVETSLFTGKLNIVIPIYTLNDPDFDLNIALRYNSEAFKPNKQSGYVGYNWFLEAGGCITREVKNLADEMDRKDATHQIPHQGMLVFTKRHNIDNVKIFNLDTTDVVIPCNNYNHYNLLTCDTTVDYLPDIFHFNFCNHQGSFIIDNDGEAIILNGDFVKVDLSRLVDCESNHNGQKLPIPNPSSQITLTTLDGYTYIFGGDLSSLGYTLNTVSDSETNIPIQDAPTVNTWYLRQIIAPNNRDILFHYKSHLKDLTNDSNYIDYRDPIWSFTEYRDQLIGAPYHGIKDYNQQLRQSITKECILDSIVVKGNQRLTIEFCNRVDSFKLYPYNMCMKNYMLDMIRIKNNESILQTAQLQSEYTHSTSAQGAPYNYWRFLSSVNISGIGKYIMSYDNSNTFPLIGISDDNYQDNISNFGYYTRSHTLGLLSSIIYPTGGTQTLTYTQHECGKERRFSTDSDAHVSLSDTSNLYLPLGRGVRIDEIKSYLDNTLIETKSYSYTRKDTSLSSGIYYNTLGVFNKNRPNAVEIIKNAFNYSLIESYIGYSTITETTTYHSTNDTQKVIYSFNTGISSYSSRNDLINRINQTHYSNDSIAAILSGMLVYDGNLIPNGQLLSIEYYKNNLPLRTKQYIYNGISNTTGVIQNSQYPSLGCTDTVVIFADHHIAIARKLFVYPSVLTEEITKDFLTNNKHVYNTRNILHDTKLRNKQEWITNSDGITYFTRNTYPDDIVTPTMAMENNPYVHLCARNQINVPLEQVSGYIKDGAEYVLSGKVNEYAVGGMMYMSNTPRGITPFDSIGPLLPTDQYPYLSRNLELQISGEINDYTPLSLNGTNLVYDSRYRSTCNYRFDHNLRLIEITPVNQITTTYTWDGIYPVSQTVGNQTSTYTYVPYVGISSITDARGLKIGYSYDLLASRLTEEYIVNAYHQKEVLHAYSYYTKLNNTDATPAYRVDMSPLEAVSNISFNHFSLSPTNQNTLSTIHYYDGFGRPYESVSLQQSPNRNDLISMTSYNGLNRATHQWLPISEDANGQALSPSEFSNKATTFYGDSRPYQETLYESSALDRIVGAVRPGAAHATHPSTQTYEINAESNIKLFSVVWQSQSNGAVETRLKCGNSNYGLYTLYKSTTSDEDGKSITTFTDKLGRVILERQDGNDTYYVYDKKGQLCYVLPPLASNQISAGTYSNDTDVLKKYAYVYKYDERGNQIYKRLPGCEPTLMVYDVTNMLVMSQTGNQRERGSYWMVCRYDSLRRLIYTSEVNVGGTYEAYLSSFREWYMREGFSTGTHNYPMANTGYSRGYFHNRPTELLTVNYYDTYDFLQFVPNAAQSHMAFAAFSGNNSYANAQGLLTGTRTYYLDGSGNYSETVYYYDYRGREIQRRSTNHLGGYDVLSTKYNFSNITDTWSSQSTKDGLTTTEHYQYTYDHANRPLTTTYTLNNGAPIVLQSYHYDELGRVSSRHLYGGIDSIAFSYDMHNQITRIKSAGYEQNYYYHQQRPTNDGMVSGVYNGNISATTWSYGNKTNGYEYIYDNMNRLSITYGIVNGTWADGCYSESFMYDAHGNIKTIYRWDDHEIMNNLSLTYDGNQLVRVDDTGLGSYDYSIKQYHDNNSSVDFAYDANGNMKHDNDRGIATIRYNLLNLPETIQFSNGNQIVHRYDAAGNRLATDYYTRKINVTVPLGEIFSAPDSISKYHVTRDAFHNNMVYNVDNANQYSIEFVHNPEGYIRYLTPEEHYPFYYIKDLLGNIRETYVHPEAGYKECIQRMQYYPSGLPWLEAYSPSEQPYKYNGKEFVEMHGLDEYDSKARWYYPAICRTTTMDPLAEKYYATSPYAWCGNNPIRNIDPDGRKVVFAKDVSISFKNDFRIAVEYMNEHKISGMLYQLEKSPQTYYIAEGEHIDGSYYSRATRTITWSSLTGLQTSNGYKMSPVEILNHEIDHALQHDKNPNQQTKDINTNDSQYENKEEKRVIEGSEQTTAQKLGKLNDGEVTRSTHKGGKIYETISPVSDEKLSVSF